MLSSGLAPRSAPAVVLALAVVLCLSGAGCSVYDRSLIPDGSVPPTDLGMHDSGGRDAGPGVDLGPPGLLHPPPRPSVADGTDMPDIAFAFREVRLNQGSDAWRTIGFDLDGLNTTPLDQTVECQPPDGTAGPEIDGEMGIDNGFGDQIYPLVGVVMTDLESMARVSELAGKGAIVVRAHGWNGMDDDPHVEVTIAQSVLGTTASASMVNPATGLLTSGGTPPPPAWDGNDTFFVRDDAFVGRDPTQPLIVDTNAYVAHRQVVLTLPSGTDIFFFAGTRAIDVKFSAAVAVATISADDTTLSDVTVAGRWAITEMLRAGARLGFCPGSTTYCILQNALRQHADIRTVPGTGGPAATCDALSLGVTFTGKRVAWGGLTPSPALPDACAGMAMTPCP